MNRWNTRWLGLAALVAVMWAPLVTAGLPVVSLGANQTVNVGDVVQLAYPADAATAPTQGYLWHFWSKPAGSQATITDSSSANTSFVADVPGTFIVRVVVGNVTSLTISALASITAVAQPLVTAFDHGPTTAMCVSCHDGITATGRTAQHAVTSGLCEACHSVATWAPTVLLDHEQLAEACLSCHDDVRAIGMGPTHIPTSLACDACHIVNTATPTWLPTNFNHELLPNGGVPCLSCHDFSHPPAVAKGPLHLPTSDACESCHNITNWLVTGSFNHEALPNGGVPCQSCHDGAHPPADGRSATHPATTLNCQSCHLSRVVWTASPLNHLEVLPSSCNTCHDGVRAIGQRPTHIPTNGLACDVCHGVTASTPSWAPTTFNHGLVSNQACVACHDNIHPPALGKSPLHPPTSDACGSCHGTTTWVLAQAPVDHSRVTGVCASCHNGLNSTGKGVTHINTTTACAACHTSVAWLPVVRVDHRQVLGRCSTCHNGTVATGKPPRHLRTKKECSVCHRTSSWKKRKD